MHRDKERPIAIEMEGRKEREEKVFEIRTIGFLRKKIIYNYA